MYGMRRHRFGINDKHALTGRQVLSSRAFQHAARKRRPPLSRRVIDSWTQPPDYEPPQSVARLLVGYGLPTLLSACSISPRCPSPQPRAPLLACLDPPRFRLPGCFRLPVCSLFTRSGSSSMVASLRIVRLSSGSVASGRHVPDQLAQPWGPHRALATVPVPHHGLTDPGRSARSRQVNLLGTHEQGQLAWRFSDARLLTAVHPALLT